MRRILQTVLAAAIVAVMALTGAGCGPEHAYPDCMTGWSPDGAKVALVPNFLDADPEQSGLWLHDFESGTTRRLLELPPDLYALHPQWSPGGEAILFTLVDKDPEQNPAGHFRYSIWTCGPLGDGLRLIAEGTSPGEAEGAPLLLPGAVQWGAFPGTVIFQQAGGDRVTALWTDPYTGRGGPFLPSYADGYTIQPSPCRKWAAALMYQKSEKGHTADVLLSDFGYGNWRSLGVIDVASDSPDASLTRTISWAPDSCAFVVSEIDDDGTEAATSLRLFDLGNGRWTTIDAGGLSAPPWWSGDSLFFSAPSGIYRVDARQGPAKRLVQGKGIRLLSLNASNGRLYFYVESHGDSDPKRQFYSCRTDGHDLRALQGDLPADGDFTPSVSPDGSCILLGLSPLSDAAAVIRLPE